MKEFEALITKERLYFIINAVEKLTTEIPVQCRKDHIKISAVDPAHVAMMNIEAHKNFFEKYESTDFDMGIDVDKMSSMVPDDLDNETNIFLKYLDDVNKLMISYDGIVHRMKLV